MPTFIEVKKWIIEAAREMGAEMSTRRAKGLAGDYLAAIDADPTLRYSVLTYADPTGEAAVRRWFMTATA